VNITSKHVAKLFLYNIISRHGVPYELIRDQGSHFKKKVVTLLKKYRIQHHKSSPYSLQANGAIEVANKMSGG